MAIPALEFAYAGEFKTEIVMVRVINFASDIRGNAIFHTPMNENKA